MRSRLPRERWMEEGRDGGRKRTKVCESCAERASVQTCVGTQINLTVDSGPKEQIVQLDSNSGF